MQEINIKEIIYKKSPEQAKKIPNFVYKIVSWILKTKEINEYYQIYGNRNGIEFVKSVLYDITNTKVVACGIENIPKEGKITIVSNHPLGGLDGLALIDTVYPYRKDIVFPVNDFLTYIPNLKEFFVPINKVGANSREAVLGIERSFQQDNTILYFPAGLCSRRINKEIIDLEWKPTFVKQSKVNERTVIPVHIKGKNSNFFYNLANIRKKLNIKFNIEMMFLPREMFKQRNKTIEIIFGKPIPWQEFTANQSNKEWADIVKQKSYSLK